MSKDGFIFYDIVICMTLGGDTIVSSPSKLGDMIPYPLTVDKSSEAPLVVTPPYSWSPRPLPQTMIR